MYLVKPSFKIENISNDNVLQFLEKSGRVCYKSEDRITEDSAEKFVKMISKSGHESVIEHVNATVRFIANRGFLAELTRHRLASYSVESTRYCNYGKKGVTFVIPPWVNIEEGEYKDYEDFIYLTDKITKLWYEAMEIAEEFYNHLLHEGCSPQQARGVLPIDLKTEIIMTANIREWKHVFDLRCSKAAHPQMRELMIPLREEFRKRTPIIFDGG